MDQQKPEENLNYLPIFMAIGVSVGLAIGAGMDNIPIGMCIGLSVGVGVGAILDAQKRKKNDNPSQSNKQDETE